MLLSHLSLPRILLSSSTGHQDWTWQTWRTGLSSPPALLSATTHRPVRGPWPATYIFSLVFLPPSSLHFTFQGSRVNNMISNLNLINQRETPVSLSLYIGYFIITFILPLLASLCSSISCCKTCHVNISLSLSNILYSFFKRKKRNLITVIND